MTTPAPDPRARYAGLDGLRAVAVGLVVVHHVFPPEVLPGGFVGVDVFFVISGFLITSLLLRERTATGRIGLVAFWRRRARRLLPALFLVVAVCATAAWLIGGDVLVRLGAQVLGAFTFSYNWVSIAGDVGYFGGDTPELFRNLWSLAVEEQFYVLWPLVLPVILLLPRTWARAGAVLSLAVASAVWMGVVAASGDVTRAYFGIDTHAFGILLGAALAFVLAPLLRRVRPREPAPVLQLAGGWTVVAPTRRDLRSDASPRTRVRITTSIVGATSLIGLLVVAMVPPALGPATFPGAIVASSTLSGAAIVAAVWPGSVFGPLLDRQPLRWIGDRSYGIYLWHWPLLVLAVAALQGSGPEAGFSPWLGLGVLVATLVVSELSYRFVETPVRRYGFRGTARRLPVATALAAVLVVGGTSAAIASAPAVSSGEAAVRAGAAALAEASASPVPTPTPTLPAPMPTTPAPEPSAAPVVVPSVTGDQVTAIGDSVMLASAPGLLERLPGVQVDAIESRGSWLAPAVVAELAASGGLRPYVVLAIGTNGSVPRDVLEEIRDIAGRERQLVLVNAYAPRDWIPGVNADLTAFARAHRNVTVADWAGAIGAQPELLAGDQIHPGDAGGRIFADVIATTLDGIAQRRHDDAQRLAETVRRPSSRALE